MASRGPGPLSPQIVPMAADHGCRPRGFPRTYADRRRAVLVLCLPATKWLGDGYQEIASGVFRSADNTRQFRMVGSNLEGAVPHVNSKIIAPDGRKIIENSHIRIIDP